MALPDQRQDGSQVGTPDSVGWRLMVAIILSSLMGVGVLVSPTDMQRLGWLPGAALLVLFASSSAYSGLLYARLFAQMPWATTLYDLSGALKFWGPTLTTLVYASAYAAPLVFQLVSRGALMQVVGAGEGSALTPVRAGLIVVLLLAPTSFVENLGEIGWLSTFGSGSMAAAMATLCAKLLFVEPRPDEGAVTHLIAPTSLNQKLIGVLDILFIFGGQANWGRFIESMAGQRKMFAYSAALASLLLLLVASAVASVGYACLGGHLELNRPIVDSLRPDMWTKLINAGVLSGIYVMMAVQINVCTQLLLEALRPSLFKPAPHGHTLGGRWGHHRYAPYKLTRKLAVQRQRQEAAEEDDCAVAGAGTRDASSTDKGESLAKTRDAGLTHKKAAQGGDLAEPLLPPRPAEEDLMPTRLPRAPVHPVGTGTPGGSPGSWQITVPDLAHTQLPQSPQQQKLQHYQNQHQQQQQHHSDSPSLEGAPQDGAQEADGEPDGTGGPGSTAGSQHQTLQSDGVSGNHQIVLYTEDERGYGRDVLLQAPRSSLPLPSEQQATKRALTKRSLWAFTSFSLMVLYWALSLALPFVPEVMALIAALGVVTAMLLLPCGLALKLLRLPKAERVVCVTGCILSIALTIAGCAAAIKEMGDSL